MAEAACFREEKQRWREERRAEIRELAATDEPLAHLLALLDASAEYFREIGADGDAVVIESHRSQLIAGRERPGEPIKSPFPPELHSVSEEANHGG